MPRKPAAHSFQSKTVEGQLERLRDYATREPTDMSAPKTLTTKQRELWDAVVETRDVRDWTRADRTLLQAYVRAWSDIDKMQDELDKEGLVVAGGRNGREICNPKLAAMGLRIQHMSLLFLRLGMQLKAPPTLAEASSLHRSKAKTAGIMSAVASDDDGLLASYQ